MFELKFKGNRGPMEQYRFLKESISMIDTSREISALLQEFAEGKKEYEDIQDTLESLLIVNDFKAFKTPGYGMNMVTDEAGTWLQRAVSVYNDTYSEITLKLSICLDLTHEEARGYSKDLLIVAGSLSFVLLTALGVLENISDLELLKEIDTNEGISEYTAEKFDGSFVKMFSKLYDVYISNPPFIPYKVEFPDEWDAFTETIHEADVFNEVMDYSEYLLAPDVFAIMAGKVTVDESLLAVLRNRENNIFLPYKLFPYKVFNLINTMPKEDYDMFIKYETKLSEELIDEYAVSGMTKAFEAKLDAAPTLDRVYKDVVTVWGGQLGMGTDETSWFSEE